MPVSAMICLGRCCAFREQPICFRHTTAAAIGRVKRVDAPAKLSDLCMRNAR